MKLEKIKNVIYLIFIFCFYILYFYLRNIFFAPIDFYFVLNTLICGVLLFIFLSKRKKLKTIISFILFLYLKLADIISLLYIMIENAEMGINNLDAIIISTLFMIAVIYFTITNFRLLILLEYFYLLIHSISLIDTVFLLSL